MDTPVHPALRAGHVAVVTGAASGICLAAARRFASLDLQVCMADLDGDALKRAMEDIDSPDLVFTETVDVSDPNSIDRLADTVAEHAGRYRPELLGLERGEL